MRPPSAVSGWEDGKRAAPTSRAASGRRCVTLLLGAINPRFVRTRRKRERTRRVSARLRAVTVCGGGLADRNLPRAEARAPARQHTVNLCIAGRGDTLKKSKYLRSAAHTRQDQPLLREESDDDDVHGGGGSMSSSICVRASDPLHQSLNRQLFALRHQAEQALLRALELRDQLHAPPTRGQKVDL